MIRKVEIFATPQGAGSSVRLDGTEVPGVRGVALFMTPTEARLYLDLVAERVEVSGAINDAFLTEDHGNPRTDPRS